MNISFRNQEHQEFYAKYAELYPRDIERKCFFYSIGVSRLLRENVEELYDFRINKIRIDAIHQPWLTDNTEKLLRFALAMYGSRPITATYLIDCEKGTYKDAYEEACRYDISEFFSDRQDAPFMLEAIKLRYSLG